MKQLLAVVLFFGLNAYVVLQWVNMQDNDPMSDNLTGPVAPEVDVSKEPEQEPELITELPALEDINIGEEPLLYDFVSGCLDWHIPIYRGTLDSDLYILRHSSSPQILYTDWYVTQGGYTVPPTGTSIERIELVQRDLDKFETILSTVSSDYIIEDGEWQLIIYAGEAASTLNKLDLGLRKDYPYAEGRVPPFIESGMGWPTVWLRREPYASRLASEGGIDINDSWWDNFSLEGRYDLQQTGVSTETHDYYAVCTGVMEFLSVMMKET